MHILIFIILFIIGSISAAAKGDWSGIEVLATAALVILAFFIFGVIVISL